METSKENNYIPAKSVKKMLKLDDCSVMHLRTSGKVKFTKEGNSYLYLTKDIEKLVNKKD